MIFKSDYLFFQKTDKGNDYETAVNHSRADQNG